MALKYYTGDKITGLSTDTKPTTIGDGATFYETDTKKIYIKVSGSWVEVNYQSALGFTPENVANKRTSFQSTPDDTHYPSEKLVKDSLDTKMINPMTASGDIIYGGNNGAPTRLAKGTDGQVLTLSSGVPAWVSGGEGSGDVSGPEGATADNIAVFDGTTGKLIKDGGKGLPSGAVVGDTDAQTLTNKRINPRVYSTTSTSSLTPDSDSYDRIDITALAANITINNPSGTPVNFQQMIIALKDDGTSRTITWGNKYASGDVTLPTATTAGKWLYIGLKYNSTADKWHCLAVGNNY